MKDQTLYQYKITFTPVDSYFFGSEKSFNPVEGKSNYLVKSLKVPQQTTLLGTLRYALLKGLITVDNNHLEKCLSNEELIGKHSFNGEDKPFGIIDHISPLYIQTDKGSLLVEAGLDRQLYDGKLKEFIYQPNPGKSKLINSKEFIPNLVGFDPKKENDHNYMYRRTADPSAQIFHLFAGKDIFIGRTRPGNNIQSDTDGYYVQTRYSLTKGFAFVVYLQTTLPLTADPYIAFMGGDSSEFKVTLEPAEYIFCDKEPEATGSGKVWLISDTFLSEEDLGNCDFSITETNDFRYIQTTLATTQYANLGSKKSTKTILAAKGSVFYCKDIGSFVKPLLERGAYRRIGYNYFDYACFDCVSNNQ